MRIQLLFLMLLIAAMHTFGNAAAQSVSLSARKVPLSKILDQIEHQTGYYFAYKVQTVEDLFVTVELKNVTLQEALEACFKNLPVNYKISERTIVVSRKPQQNGQVAPEVMAVPPVNITGVITTSEGQPFPGVTVRVKGTSVGTVTDADGRYTIAAERGAVLVFSYVGFQVTEMRVTEGQKDISFALVENASQLKETVVKGYYTTTKELNTGSVGTLKGEDIAKQPISDPLMALQGRIPGLNIIQTSGVPGAGLKVNLRGRNSIANGTEPLYIVDGIPFNPARLNQNPNAADRSNNGLSPFQSIRPEDIESIDVLKDADATAIYGSRGANGVIIISTKKGKIGETVIAANVNTGFGHITRSQNLMNSEQYLEMRNEAFKNDGTLPGLLDYDVNGTWEKNKYTNWQEKMIGGTARVNNANISVSGGSAQTQFVLGGSYRKESTVYPGEYNDKIASGNFNIHHDSENKRFKTDLSVNYSNNNLRLPTTDLTRYIALAPNTPELYKENGELNFANGTFDNPLSLLNQKSKSVTENFLSQLNLAYDIAKGLQIRTSFGFNSMIIKETNTLPLNSFNPFTVNAALARTLVQGSNQRKSWIVEPQVNYSFAIGKHSIDAIVGTSFQQSQQDGIRQTGTGFSNDQLIEDITAATSVTNTTNFSTYRYAAMYARLGYNFQKKYVVNLTGRRDGSSRFGPDKRFGNFGALGAAWIFTKEDFVSKNLPFLSFGKLRGSIGRTGNDQLVDYAYLSTYIANSAVYLGGTTLTPLRLANPIFGWETINKIEFGVDLSFFDSRIDLSLNVFRNRTENQLVGYSLPLVTGFGTIIANLPAIIQNSGLEIVGSSINIKTENFSWVSSINLTVPKNKLISYPNIQGSSYNQVFAVGQPLSIQYVYKFNGVDPATGLYKFEDFNKDGSISSDKDRYPKFLGQRFFGGVSNGLSYNGISLDFLFQFVKQTGFNGNMNTSPGIFLEGGFNQTQAVYDRWKGPTELGFYQKYSTKFTDVYRANVQFGGSDAKITDASYIRLKNVELSWHIPSEWESKIKVKSLRLFLQGQNLWTITNFKGADPESQQYGVINGLPPLKILVAGIQLKL